MEDISANNVDAVMRIKKLIRYSIDYWSRNLATYGLRYVSEVLDPLHNSNVKEGGAFIETSPCSGRIHAVFHRAASDFFRTLPGAPTAPPLAGDALLAAAQGVLL